MCPVVDRIWTVVRTRSEFNNNCLQRKSRRETTIRPLVRLGVKLRFRNDFYLETCVAFSRVKGTEVEYLNAQIKK